MQNTLSCGLQYYCELWIPAFNAHKHGEAMRIIKFKQRNAIQHAISYAGKIIVSTIISSSNACSEGMRAMKLNTENRSISTLKLWRQIVIGMLLHNFFDQIHDTACITHARIVQYFPCQCMHPCKNSEISTLCYFHKHTAFEREKSLVLHAKHA